MANTTITRKPAGELAIGDHLLDGVITYLFADHMGVSVQITAHESGARDTREFDTDQMVHITR